MQAAPRKVDLPVAAGAASKRGNPPGCQGTISVRLSFTYPRRRRALARMVFVPDEDHAVRVHQRGHGQGPRSDTGEACQLAVTSAHDSTSPRCRLSSGPPLRVLTNGAYSANPGQAVRRPVTEVAGEEVPRGQIRPGAGRRPGEHRLRAGYGNLHLHGVNVADLDDPPGPIESHQGDVDPPADLGERAGLCLLYTSDAADE